MQKRKTEGEPQIRDPFPWDGQRCNRCHMYRKHQHYAHAHYFHKGRLEFVSNLEYCNG